jgi:ribose transport system substrate-binding protein
MDPTRRRRAGSRRRGWIAALLLAFLAAAALGCGDDDDSDASGGGGGGGGEEKVNIAFFGLAAENAYTQYMYDAATAEAEKMNAEVQFFDGKFEGPAQVTQMQDAITSGRFQGFIVMPNDQPGIVPVVEQALAEGIKVAALQFPVGTDPTEADPEVDGMTTQVIEDVIRGAEVTAEGINATCVDRDPCEVGILWGARSVSWEAAKEKPLKEALDSNVEIVAEADAGFLQGPGEKATADMLEAHPGLDVLATPSGDQMTTGGQRAIEAKGKEIGLADRPDDAIAIVGYGAAETGVQRVRDKVWYQTYALVPETMARETTRLLIEDVRGTAPSQEQRGIVQTEISPVGDNITLEVLGENPDWKAEWQG